MTLAYLKRNTAAAASEDRTRAEDDAAIAAQREAQRAWVTVTGVAFGPRAHLMDMPAAVITLLNSGQRPATVTEHAVSIAICRVGRGIPLLMMRRTAVLTARCPSARLAA